jgi:hypothetical protein
MGMGILYLFGQDKGIAHELGGRHGVGHIVVRICHLEGLVRWVPKNR